MRTAHKRIIARLLMATGRVSSRVGPACSTSAGHHSCKHDTVGSSAAALEPLVPPVHHDSPPSTDHVTEPMWVHITPRTLKTAILPISPWPFYAQLETSKRPRAYDECMWARSFSDGRLAPIAKNWEMPESIAAAHAATRAYLAVWQRRRSNGIILAGPRTTKRGGGHAKQRSVCAPRVFRMSSWSKHALGERLQTTAMAHVLYECSR